MAVGVTNNTIFVCHMKSMDMHLWWLRCRESQEHYCYYWGPGHNNEGNYSKKHHPPLYHEAKRPIHSCIRLQYLQGCVTLLLFIELAERLRAQGQTFTAVTKTGTTVIDRQT